MEERGGEIEEWRVGQETCVSVPHPLCSSGTQACLLPSVDSCLSFIFRLLYAAPTSSHVKTISTATFQAPQK